MTVVLKEKIVKRIAFITLISAVGTSYCPDPAAIKQKLQSKLQGAAATAIASSPAAPVQANPAAAVNSQVVPPAAAPAPQTGGGNVQAFMSTVNNKSLTDMRTGITQYKANLDTMDSCLDAFQKVLGEPKEVIAKNKDFYQKFSAATPDQQKQMTIGSDFSDIDKQAFAKVQDLMTKLPAQNSKSFLDLIIKQLDAASK